ncbi:MAG: TatD family hydrolase [Minisyncoccia bacterium]|jgi:TatD DNase family protein
MIDSHCHPQFPQYDNDREEMIKRALDAGVYPVKSGEAGAKQFDGVKMICVGTDLETSKQAIELAEKYEGIWATVGLHPNDKPNFQFSISDFQELLDNKKVVAIGEVGLDYYRIINPAEKQKEIFKQFIELAIRKNLPLVIHSRDTHNDLVELLSAISSRLSSAPGVIHSFTGSWLEAKQFIDLGFYIGLNGIITFSDDYAEMVSQIPLEKILLETDAPYLAPPPFRGKRNEPLFVKYVAQKIAEIKNESIEKIIEITTKNAKKLFKI